MDFDNMNVRIATLAAKEGAVPRNAKDMKSPIARQQITKAMSQGLKDANAGLK